MDIFEKSTRIIEEQNLKNIIPNHVGKLIYSNLSFLKELSYFILLIELKQEVTVSAETNDTS